MKLLFCQSTPIAFFPSSLLKLPSKALPSFPIHHLNLLIPPLQFSVSHPSLVSFTLCLNTGWDQFFFPLLSFYFPLFETSNQPLPFTKKKINKINITKWKLNHAKPIRLFAARVILGCFKQRIKVSLTNTKHQCFNTLLSHLFVAWDFNLF